VLKLKKERYITIGDSITVKVLDTRDNEVTLGIEAPDDVRIRRDGAGADFTPPPPP
jgi:carbon storage regulator CsrA